MKNADLFVFEYMIVSYRWLSFSSCTGQCCSAHLSVKTEQVFQEQRPSHRGSNYCYSAYYCIMLHLSCCKNSHFTLFTQCGETISPLHNSHLFNSLSASSFKLERNKCNSTCLDNLMFWMSRLKVVQHLKAPPTPCSHLLFASLTPLLISSHTFLTPLIFLGFFFC